MASPATVSESIGSRASGEMRRAVAVMCSQSRLPVRYRMATKNTGVKVVAERRWSPEPK